MRLDIVSILRFLVLSLGRFDAEIDRGKRFLGIRQTCLQQGIPAFNQAESFEISLAAPTRDEGNQLHLRAIRGWVGGRAKAI
jgi:hypothetical protein